MGHISENLKMLRIMHGLSLKQLAARIGCSSNTLSNWEKGIGSPKSSFIEKLCDFYDITPSQLLGVEPCDKLERFNGEHKAILDRIEALQKEKSDIEFEIRMLYRMINPNQSL